MSSQTHTSCCGTHRTTIYMALAVILGLVAGALNISWIMATAGIVSDLFINLLKLVSLPIIFLSIVSTASGMGSVQELRILGSRVLKYTILTTVIAAFTALALFLLIDPVSAYTGGDGTSATQAVIQPNYIKYFIQMVPANIIEPFLNNNVVGVLFIAILLSLATISLADETRKTLHALFSALYAAVMKITTGVIALMPIAIWAFVTLFVKDLREGLPYKSLAFYLLVVLAANLIQALVVLPIFLRAKGLSPLKMVKAMFPALSVAFFAKSSSGALPMAIRCAQEKAGISAKIANFSLPLCTTINMNGCAAFILTTVLFVAMINGMQFSFVEMLVWVGIATVAAIGNAGVPMGCYFMSTAFLVAMDVPLHILGVILPFYSFIDMLESAINVWSDSCVTAVVDKEVAEATAALADGSNHFAQEFS